MLAAARQVLGWRLRTEFDGSPTEVILTEVEAYAGLDDPASHAYRGRTKRNGSLFAGPGTLYVYRSYGIHWCMNVVVADAATPNAVLLRGGVPRRVLARPLISATTSAPRVTALANENP